MTNPYFEQGIFGPAGILAESTPRRDGYTLKYTVGGLGTTAYWWIDDYKDCIASHESDALNACRCAAEDWLMKRDGYVYIQHCGERGYNVQDIPLAMASTIDLALIAAIKHLAGKEAEHAGE
jgi:hypothetical protein